ncbi:MAG: hypothetical protein ACRBBN_14390 [Methyloligellaceae bacterium]
MQTSAERETTEAVPVEDTDQFIADAREDKPEEDPRHEPDTKLADIRLCFGAYFLVIIAGKERRGSDRLNKERKARPVFTVRNIPLLMIIWSSLIYSFYSLVSVGLQSFISALG